MVKGIIMPVAIARKPFAENSLQILEYINPEKKVRVYRNLHKKCLSVKQDGIVRCHASYVSLKDCSFIVNAAGQNRVRTEKRKNVHSYIEGLIIDSKEYKNNLPYEWQPLYYNPYKTDHWVEVESGKYVAFARLVELNTISVIGFDIVYK
jgi:hypothetical protein